MTAVQMRWEEMTGARWWWSGRERRSGVRYEVMVKGPMIMMMMMGACVIGVEARP